MILKIFIFYFPGGIITQYNIDASTFFFAPKGIAFLSGGREIQCSFLHILQTGQHLNALKTWNKTQWTSLVQPTDQETVK